MSELTAFLRWLVEYALGGGFWHFIGVFLIVRAITGITTFVRFSIKSERKDHKTEGN